MVKIYGERMEEDGRGWSETMADGHETNRSPQRSTNGSRVISPSPETSRICGDTRYDVGKSGTELSEKTTRIYRVEIGMVERERSQKLKSQRQKQQRQKWWRQKLSRQRSKRENRRERPLREIVEIEIVIPRRLTQVKDITGPSWVATESTTRRVHGHTCDFNSQQTPTGTSMGSLAAILCLCTRGFAIHNKHACEHLPLTRQRFIMALGPC